MHAPTITIEATVHAPIDHVWELWTLPEHIKKWNNASENWHTPRATSDLREGGKFSSRMESKDGTVGFDFGGTFTNVLEHSLISYVMDDGRKVKITFDEVGDSTHIIEIFDAEMQNPADLQRKGWQSILNNFKKYAEG